MGIAPKLKGIEDIGAGWKMLIMDTRDGEYGPFDKDTLPAGTHGQRGNAGPSFIKPTLCTAMRDANITVRNHDKLGFMPVDFDYLVMDHW